MCAIPVYTNIYINERRWVDKVCKMPIYIRTDKMRKIEISTIKPDKKKLSFKTLYI